MSETEKERGILIGIAGGSGSGKTMVSQRIVSQLGTGRVVIIEQDSYYKDLSHLPFEERAAQNFDHPDSIDTELLIRQIRDLLHGRSADIPVYDFTTHNRRSETRHTGPHDVIVLEGILMLYNPELREMMDIKVYVDTDGETPASAGARCSRLSSSMKGASGRCTCNLWSRPSAMPI